MTHRFCRILPIFALLMGLLTAWPTPGSGEPLSPRLQSILTAGSPTDSVPIIVTFHHGVQPLRQADVPRQVRRSQLIRQLKDQAATIQAPVREFLRSRNHGPLRELWVVNGLALSASRETIEALAARPEVAEIVYDEVLTLPEISPALIAGPAESNLTRIKAPELWGLGYAGQGVVVATMDSGVDLSHPDLTPRWRGGGNSWFDPNGEHPALPADTDGHGTSIMGVMVGGNAGGTYIGVAPEARWIAVKIFNDAGSAPSSVIFAGFDWLLDPDGNPATDDAPDLVNCSWGFEEVPGICDSSVGLFRNAVRTLKEAGIAVIFPAGNKGPAANTSVAPGSYTEAFAVGSIGTMLSPTTISTFSGRGPSACDGSIYPEIVAPGFAIKTADLSSQGSYIYSSGTSVAAPHAAGVMALLLSAFPGTPVEALESALKTSAADLGAAGPDNSYGYGLVNARGAFDLLNDALLSLIDPVAPGDDGLLPFGHIPVGSTSSQSITLRNNGSGLLFIQSVTIPNSFASPFSITANSCGTTLAAGASCTVAVRFAPQTHQSHTIQLQVVSNGTPGGNAALTLTGIGNTAPPPPRPTSPAADAIAVSRTVELRWELPVDADRDTLHSEVRIGTGSDLSDTVPIEVATTGARGGNALLAGLGVMLGGGAFITGRRRKILTALLLAGTLGLLLSCGGGGGEAVAGVQ